MKPTRVHLEKDAEILVEWSREHENILHETSMDAIEQMLIDPTIEELVVIEFYQSQISKYPFADITMHREDINESLELAQEFFVSTEEYELALRAKNLKELVNKITNTQTT